MERVRLRPDVTDADEAARNAKQATGKAGVAWARRRYARTRNYDVTYAYSPYATLVLARDASPLERRLHWRVDLESRRK